LPTDVISNPAWANNPPGALLTPQTDDYWALDPNVSVSTLTSLIPTVLPSGLTAPGAGVGVVVELQSWNGSTSGASGSPTHPTVKLSATTADGLIVGVTQGTTTGLQAATTTGQVFKTRRYGIGLVLVDNTTTVGHALVQSTGTAGVAHDSGGVTGTTNETIGVALQALTVNAGIGIIYALIKLT